MRCALQRWRFREIFLQSKRQNRADSPSVGSAALIGGFRAALDSGLSLPRRKFFYTAECCMLRKEKGNNGESMYCIFPRRSLFFS